jgi:hypothetical protein
MLSTWIIAIAMAIVTIPITYSESMYVCVTQKLQTFVATNPHHTTTLNVCTAPTALPSNVSNFILIYDLFMIFAPPFMFKYVQRNDNLLRKRFFESGYAQTLRMRVALKRNVQATQVLYETSIFQVDLLIYYYY